MALGIPAYQSNDNIVVANIEIIPEPSSLSLLVAGLAVLMAGRRRLVSCRNSKQKQSVAIPDLACIRAGCEGIDSVSFNKGVATLEGKPFAVRQNNMVENINPIIVRSAFIVAIAL